MNCPICDHTETRVIRSQAPRRRRECCRCGHRWNSIEIMEDRLMKAEQATAKIQALAAQLAEEC